MCYALDLAESDHYALEDCSVKLRELCYLNDVSRITPGESTLYITCNVSISQN